MSGVNLEKKNLEEKNQLLYWSRQITERKLEQQWWEKLLERVVEPVFRPVIYLTQQQVGQKEVTEMVGDHGELEAIFRHLSLVWDQRAGVVDL